MPERTKTRLERCMECGERLRIEGSARSGWLWHAGVRRDPERDLAEPPLRPRLPHLLPLQPELDPRLGCIRVGNDCVGCAAGHRSILARLEQQMRKADDREPEADPGHLLHRLRRLRATMQA